MDPEIRQALGARRFARAVLSPGQDGRDALLGCDPELFRSLEGWRLFLRVERCAYPLRQVLEQDALLPRLPAPFEELLRHEAEWELEHIRSARRQLHLIGAWAVRHGCRPIVLKGGLSALDHSGIDLNDLDILLPKAEGERLVAALLEQGYRQCGSAGVIHLRGIQRQGELMIEVHSALTADEAESAWARRNPQAIGSAAAGLWRLPPGDHLWHVLMHAVVTHTPRRGRIRDLLLLGEAIAGCPTQDLEDVRRRVAKHELCDVLESALGQGLDWSQGKATTDPFEEVALIGYLLASRRENRARVHPTSGMVNSWVYAQLLGPVERRTMWSSTLVVSPDLSGFFPVRRLQLLSPRLGRLVQVTGRFLTRAGAYARAYPVAAPIRRLLRERRLQKSNLCP